MIKFLKRLYHRLFIQKVIVYKESNDRKDWSINYGDGEEAPDED